MKILLVSSSSGGHVYPSYELGKYLQKNGNFVRYLGIYEEIEEKIIPKEYLFLIHLPKSFKKAFKNPIQLFQAKKEAKSFVQQFDVVIGFGGFITFFYAYFLKTEKQLFYIHESNVEIGDANLLSLRKAKRIFTSFKITESKKAKEKLTCVGNPVIERVPKTKGKNISFVFGSLGSKTLLDKVSKYLINQNDSYSYLLVTSQKYYEEYKKKLDHKVNVKVVSFISSDQLYQSSDILFCRGGASTLMEVLGTDIYCVCIPSPYVKHHHQEKNASYLAEYHLLSILEEENVNEKTILEYIQYYKRKDYPLMELKNRKEFILHYPCMSIYQKIYEDIQKAKV